MDRLVQRPLTDGKPSKFSKMVLAQRERRADRTEVATMMDERPDPTQPKWLDGQISEELTGQEMTSAHVVGGKVKLVIDGQKVAMIL